MMFWFGVCSQVLVFICYVLVLGGVVGFCWYTFFLGCCFIASFLGVGCRVSLLGVWRLVSIVGCSFWV